jgi:ubiquinone/menaquinone biosynthesis C-methylase UbiE
MMSQKFVFLESEGDAWFTRNREALARRKLPDEDPILRELIELGVARTKPLRVLEIGCGEGVRLQWLSRELGAQCAGVEPSAQAVEVARARGIDARRGTADSIPFDTGAFDVVIFGFCLYLCDRDDLFLIASEANRVLARPGWLIIEDFYSTTPRLRAYHHKAGVQSHKMDFRAMFAWHPEYVTVTLKVRSHGNVPFTDEPEDWVALTVFRKLAPAPA